MKELELIAIEIRKKLLQTIVKAGGGHTGGSLSSVDILVALYFDMMNIDPGNPEMKGRGQIYHEQGTFG